ncbi:MAG: calcineurin-like phosphoesterase C-terminal domain-containing protein, partial [Fuerstiella sp.]
HTVMHFDGVRYLLEYRAARRDPSYQVRVMSPEVIDSASASSETIFANVFNAMPDAKVEWKLSAVDGWREMTRTVEADPLFQRRWEEEQALKAAGKLAWRALTKPMASPHLWKTSLPQALPAGTHTIHVRCTNPNGQVLTGQRIIRVQ